MVVGLPLTERRADRLLHALADQTRREILRSAMAAERSVSSLAHDQPMSVTAVQKHVSVLERAGLVSKHRRGRETLVRVEPTALHAAQRVLGDLEELWRTRVAAMDVLLAEPTEGG